MKFLGLTLAPSLTSRKAQCLLLLDGARHDFNLCSISLHAGTAKTLKDALIPFDVKADTSLVVALRQSGKVLTCLADIACECVQALGLTELSLEGHDLEVQAKDGCSAHFSLTTCIVLSFFVYVIIAVCTFLCRKMATSVRFATR